MCGAKTLETELFFMVDSHEYSQNKGDEAEKYYFAKWKFVAAAKTLVSGTFIGIKLLFSIFD